MVVRGLCRLRVSGVAATGHVLDMRSNPLSSPPIPHLFLHPLLGYNCRDIHLLRENLYHSQTSEPEDPSVSNRFWPSFASVLSEEALRSHINTGVQCNNILYFARRFSFNYRTTQWNYCSTTKCQNNSESYLSVDRYSQPYCLCLEESSVRRLLSQSVRRFSIQIMSQFKVD